MVVILIVQFGITVDMKSIINKKNFSFEKIKKADNDQQTKNMERDRKDQK